MSQLVKRDNLLTLPLFRCFAPDSPPPLHPTPHPSHCPTLMAPYQAQYSLNQPSLTVCVLFHQPPTPPLQPTPSPHPCIQLLTLSSLQHCPYG